MPPTCYFLKNYFVYVYVCVSTCMHMSAESEEAKRGHWVPSELESQVVVNCLGVGNLNSNSLQEWQVPLTTSAITYCTSAKDGNTHQTLVLHTYTQVWILNYNIYISNFYIKSMKNKCSKVYSEKLHA